MSSTKIVTLAPGYFVWNPVASFPKLRHLTLASARGEAKRLAAKEPGKAFYVLSPVEVSYAPVPLPTPVFTDKVVEKAETVGFDCNLKPLTPSDWDKWLSRPVVARAYDGFGF